MNETEKLDRILAILEGRPQASSAPANVYTPAGVAAVVQELSFCGVHAPPYDLVEKWLEISGSSEAVVSAVNQVLSRWRGEAELPSAPTPSPGADWRENAAYLETTKGHNGWSRVTHLLVTGEAPAPPTSLDPLTPVFDGISRADGPEDMAPIVPEVLRRAELGITWAGNQGTSGAELEERKDILAAGPLDPRFIPEWRQYQDPRLLRVLLLGNALNRTRGLGSYKLAAKPGMTLEEWLFANWRTSRPWPASPAWKAGN